MEVSKNKEIDFLKQKLYGKTETKYTNEAIEAQRILSLSYIKLKIDEYRQILTDSYEKTQSDFPDSYGNIVFVKTPKADLAIEILKHVFIVISSFEEYSSIKNNITNNTKGVPKVINKEDIKNSNIFFQYILNQNLLYDFGYKEKITTKERKKAYAEVCEILNHMSKTDVEKIPREILSYYSENADKKYSFKFDETKTFAEQKLSYIAKVVLAMFYRDYWATQEERDNITKKEKLDIKKQKEESQTDKNVLSNLNNTAKIATIIDDNSERDNTLNNENVIRPQPVSQIIAGINNNELQKPIESKTKENWYIKLINKFKVIFNKKGGT